VLAANTGHDVQEHVLKPVLQTQINKVKFYIIGSFVKMY
jgi:hypothetical protein